MKKKIGFIGLGSMASAMIGGMLRKELVKPEDILGNAKTEKNKAEGGRNLGNYHSAGQCRSGQKSGYRCSGGKASVF